MELFKNGYIVAVISDYCDFSYNAWPLADVENDDVADELTNEADDNWFTLYDMPEIAPDIDYIKRYITHCRDKGINAVVLLAETPDNYYKVNDAIAIEEVYGFDCIGAVSFSYLSEEREIFKNQIKLNKYGLFDTIDDVEEYVRIRRQAIESGEELEDYWKELPIRLSKIEL